MKIIDVRVARIGRSPIVRVLTDEGIDGFAEVEYSKPYLPGMIGIYRPLLLGCDPTEVERCMLRIRRTGGSKPWGAMVSAIEIALWDIAGKSLGVPIHRLLGGKVRDRMRVYNGGVRTSLGAHTPEDYAASMAYMAATDLVFKGLEQPSGYTEPLLHAWRLKVKAAALTV